MLAAPLCIIVFWYQIVCVLFPGEVRHVHVGASVVLGCQSVHHDRVIWRYSQLDGDGNSILYWNRRVFAKDADRFRVLHGANSSRRVFDLSISNVRSSDAGLYRCSENSVQHSAEVLYRLDVTGRCTRYNTCCQETARSFTSSIYLVLHCVSKKTRH